MKKYNNPSEIDFKELSTRPLIETSSLSSTIENIFKLVEENGDKALIELTQKYDSTAINKVAVDLENRASAQNDPSLEEAIKQASENIKKFHEAQKQSIWEIEIMEGITAGQKVTPINRVGIYIPGGTAPLLSTILMLAIPAQIAGCSEIVLCSPPTWNGSIHPSILRTAINLGITEIYQVGGAQAIAAMSIGTETIKPVSKIFGPGNQYVTAAKAYAMNYGVAMDLPAGPSELLVYGDNTSNAAFIAADLLSQAEHGIDSQVTLVSTSIELIEKVITELEQQVKTLPRKEVALKALESSRFLFFDSVDTSFDYINYYSPEHIIIANENHSYLLDKVINAGSVFLGNYCPESAGDYASGTNHTLPTNAWARSYSGVNLDAFVKKITFQKITKNGLQSIADTITCIAREEKLEAHARAIDIRLKNSTL